MTICEIKDRIRYRMQDIEASLEGMTPHAKHKNHPESVRELDTLEWVMDMLDNVEYDPESFTL